MIEINYAKETDFDYIYKLSSKNSNLLGFVHPMEIRESIKNNKIIVALSDNELCGFCIFNPLKKIPNLLTVQVICVDSNFRGNHIASNLINFLKSTYKRDIKATCVKDSDSEKFWSKIAVKYDESPGKKRPICRYMIHVTNKLF